MYDGVYNCRNDEKCYKSPSFNCFIFCKDTRQNVLSPAMKPIISGYAPDIMFMNG